jgi:hypothetical protein
MDVVTGGIAMVRTTRLAANRLVIALAAALSVALASTSLAFGAFQASEPNPLRQRATVRVQDAAATGQVVAVGWRESVGSGPGLLRVAFSTDGGGTFLKANGKLRFYSVAGQPRRGLSIDICKGRIWAASAARFPGDASGDSDVLVSRRLVGGSAGQAFVTSPAQSRTVRQVDIACAAGKLLAIAWLERNPQGMRARLMIRDQGSLTTAATNRIFELGPARGQAGISVAATGQSAYVAWSKGNRRDLQFARVDIGSGANPSLTRRETIRLATRDAIRPQVAAGGQRVVVAYTDDGKLKAKLSKNRGGTFGSASVLVGAGNVNRPSLATSIDISGKRIVVQAMKSQPKGAGQARVPVRVQSTNAGATWSGPEEFGNRGQRVSALQKTGTSTSLLKEAWHDDGPSIDLLRAQREVP